MGGNEADGGLPRAVGSPAITSENIVTGISELWQAGDDPGKRATAAASLPGAERPYFGASAP